MKGLKSSGEMYSFEGKRVVLERYLSISGLMFNILYLGAALNLDASAAAADGQDGDNFWGGSLCKQSKVYK